MVAIANMVIKQPQIHTIEKGHVQTPQDWQSLRECSTSIFPEIIRRVFQHNVDA